VLHKRRVSRHRQTSNTASAVCRDSDIRDMVPSCGWCFQRPFSCTRFQVNVPPPSLSGEVAVTVAIVFALIGQASGGPRHGRVIRSSQVQQRHALVRGEAVTQLS